MANTDLTRRNSRSAPRSHSALHPGSTRSSRTQGTAPVASRHAFRLPQKGPTPSQQQSRPGSTCDPVGSHHSSDSRTLSPSTPPNTQGKGTANCPPSIHPSSRGALLLQQPTSRAHVQLPVWSRALGLQSSCLLRASPANCERPVAAAWVSSSRSSRVRDEHSWRPINQTLYGSNKSTTKTCSQIKQSTISEGC